MKYKESKRLIIDNQIVIVTGGGAGLIVANFRTLVTAQGGTLETARCTQNVVSALLSITS